ncbi:MAG: hypothetical protein KBA81_00265 [Rhabdochlamydiaceae bacterium]|nr:hypothetical protein [Rhabdochlamydiaceae bacterium]
MQIGSTYQACHHTLLGHVFYNIRCPNQPLAHRVTLFVSAALLVSGLVWKGWSACRLSTKGTEDPKTKETDFLNKPSLPMRVYPQEGLKAIEFAKQKLLAVQSTDQHFNKFLADKNKPSYDWAVYMILNLNDEFYTKLESFILDKNIDCWTEEALIQHVDEYMKIVYAIGCLALEGIPDAVELNKHSPDFKTLTEMEKRALIVKDQGLLFFRCFTLCSYIYHHARRPALLEKDNLGHVLLKYCPPSDHYVSQFYQEGTPQFQWRLLYNDYCNRTRMYVNLDVLKKQYEWRLPNWVQPDIDAETFMPFPGTLPT